MIQSTSTIELAVTSTIVRTTTYDNFKVETGILLASCGKSGPLSSRVEYAGGMLFQYPHDMNVAQRDTMQSKYPRSDRIVSHRDEL